MLSHLASFSGFSVDNTEAALDFYTSKLGLDATHDPDMGIQLKFPTGQNVFIYQKDNHEPATYTVLNFIVPDIDAAIEELKAAGISMEHYDMPGMATDEKGVVRGGDGPKAIAWFKDPAGNILSVIQE